MNRARLVLAATLVATVYADGLLAAQTTPQAPPMTSVLAGKKLTPPLRGLAEVQFLQPKTSRDQKSDMVVTKIQVKNISSAPIARLKISETWYGKDQTIVGGSEGVIKGLLQPGEIQTIVIQTPFNAKMSANNWNFSHANGDVKPRKVTKFEEPDKEPAARQAAAKPAPAKSAPKPAAPKHQ